MFSDPGLAAERRSLAVHRDDVADIRTSVQCADITATRNIAGIWRNGTRLHREPQWPRKLRDYLWTTRSPYLSSPLVGEGRFVQLRFR
jgi:hypothetical protein